MNKTPILLLFVLLISTISFAQLDVFIQDQTTQPVDLLLQQVTGTFTFNQLPSEGDTILNISTTATFSVDDVLSMKDMGGIEFAQSKVKNITSLGGNNYIVRLQIPLDHPYDNSDLLQVANKNWAVDGSVTTQQFQISPTGLNDSLSWDITRVILTCIGDGVSGPDPKPDYTSFFVTDAVDIGIYFLLENHFTESLFGAADNEEMVERMYDVTVEQNVNKNGEYIAFARRTWGGQDKSGVALRLDAVNNNTFTLGVQDDLTDMTECSAVVQGHVVDKTVRDTVKVEELDMLNEIIQPFLIFAVGVLLLVMSSIGRSNASAFYGIAGGVWFLASATALLFTGVTITSVFFMMIGIVAIFISIGELRTNIKEGD